MTRYSKTAMVLHWAIAALLLFNFGLGQRTEDMARGLGLFAAFQFHKSVGILVLLLSLWRLWIRLRKPRPAPLGDAGWAHRLAEVVHWGFYIIMIGVPLTGWIIVSTAKIKIPTLLFGLIPWPHLPVSGPDLHEFAEKAHGFLAKAMLLLVLLHVAGALRHQFMKKEPLLERMMPAMRAGMGSVALALAVLIGSLALGRAGPLPGLSAAPSSSQVPKPLEAVELAAPPSILPAASGNEAMAEEDGAPTEDEGAKDEDKPTAAADMPVPEWRIAPGGQLGFGVTVNGDAVTGSFERWTGKIRFDAAQLDKSAIEIVIDLGSVSSGDSQRDSMLSGDDFFALAAHPRATFVATDIRSKGRSRYEARGTLSMKRVRRPVRLDFTLEFDGDVANASGTTQLRRTDFGIGTGQFEGEDTIGREVEVRFAFNAEKG